MEVKEVNRKPQAMVMLQQIIMDRTDALRVVTGRSRAEVIRQLIEKALPLMENEQRERLRRLYDVAKASDVSWEQLVQDYADRNQRNTYGERLEDLEQAAGIAPSTPV